MILRVGVITVGAGGQERKLLVAAPTQSTLPPGANTMRGVGRTDFWQLAKGWILHEHRTR